MIISTGKSRCTYINQTYHSSISCEFVRRIVVVKHFRKRIHTNTHCVKLSHDADYILSMDTQSNMLSFIIWMVNKKHRWDIENWYSSWFLDRHFRTRNLLCLRVCIQIVRVEAYNDIISLILCISYNIWNPILSTVNHTRSEYYKGTSISSIPFIYLCINLRATESWSVPNGDLVEHLFAKETSVEKLWTHIRHIQFKNQKGTKHNFSIEWCSQEKIKSEKTWKTKIFGKGEIELSDIKSQTDKSEMQWHQK